MSIVSNQIKYLRLFHKLTQEELAHKLGTSKHVISNWERGRANPDLTQLRLLADIYNVTTDYLLGRSIDYEPTRNSENNNSEMINIIDIEKIINSDITLSFNNYVLDKEDKKTISEVTNIILKRVHHTVT